MGIIISVIGLIGGLIGLIGGLIGLIRGISSIFNGLISLISGIIGLIGGLVDGLIGIIYGLISGGLISLFILFSLNLNDETVNGIGLSISNLCVSQSGASELEMLAHLKTYLT